jgi:hypothetical protein
VGSTRRAIEPSRGPIWHRIEVNRSDNQYGDCAIGDSNTRVQDFEARTLILDIVDGHTNRLIGFRFTAETSLRWFFLAGASDEPHG